MNTRAQTTSPGAGNEAPALPPVLFVGGPGRSGTSFVADRLGRHPKVSTLPDIELKIFCERNGLQDLFHVLTESYSPNRAMVAARQFRQLAAALIEGRHGQPALAAVAPAERWHAVFDAFLAELDDCGHPAPSTEAQFLAAARRLLARIAQLAADSRAESRDPAPGPASDGQPMTPFFLEKTPHNLLALPFLSRLAPGARYLHVMRDPRAIAWSLTTMRWGPDRLETAAAWVAAYCRAWTRAETFAAEQGLPLLRIHIEDVAAAPEAAAAALTAALGLEPGDAIFAGADLALLNRWTARAGAAERALLDARLGGWVRHFGYDPEAPGMRRAALGLPSGEPKPARTRGAGQGDPLIS